jgi:hypothetical protein
MEKKKLIQPGVQNAPNWPSYTPGWENINTFNPNENNNNYDIIDKERNGINENNN